MSVTELKTMVGNFDPFAALEHRHLEMSVVREMIEEAIYLIDEDRPNAAKRHLIDTLGFGPSKRLEKLNK